MGVCLYLSRTRSDIVVAKQKDVGLGAPSDLMAHLGSSFVLHKTGTGISQKQI